MSACRFAIGTVLSDDTHDRLEGIEVRVHLERGRSLEPIGRAVTDALGEFQVDLGEHVPGTDGGLYRLTCFVDGLELEAKGDTSWPYDRSAKTLVVCVTADRRCGVPSTSSQGSSSDDYFITARNPYGDPVDGFFEIRRVAFGVADTVVQSGNLDNGVANSDLWNPSLPGDFYCRIYTEGPSGGNEAEVLVWTSALVVDHAAGTLVFDATVCDDRFRRASEFERITEDLKVAVPAASDAALEAALLTATKADAEYLAAKTSWSLTQVRHRINCERIANAVAGTTGGNAAEATYGLLALRFPETVAILTKRPAVVLKNGINTARRLNIINLAIDPDAVVAGYRSAIAGWLKGSRSGDLHKILLASADASTNGTTLTSAQADAICDIASTHTGTSTAFWSLVDTALADANALAEAKRMVALGAICLGHADTMVEVLGTLDDDPVSEVGSWALTDWETALGSQTVFPSGLSGSTTTEQREELAQLLFENAQSAFPGPTLSTALRASTTDATLGTVLNRAGNESVDLLTVKLTDSPSGVTLDGPNHDAELASLRTAQRQARLAPSIGRADAVNRLETIEVRSAQDILRLGTSRFVDRYADGNPALDQEARDIVGRAAQQASMAQAFFLQAHPALGRQSLAFVPDDPVTVGESDIPGWGAMFQTPLGTRCAWCQSIHGPSAYLVDLLHWLEQKTPLSTASSSLLVDNALEALTDRRPDIAQLELTCENAERVLPYIDLTLEVLESATLGNAVPANNSEARTPDMLAAPQHTESGAYGTGHAMDTVSAFGTPFHQPLVEGRAFLDHLGVARTDLMRAFGDGISTAADIAREQLGVSIEAATAATDVQFAGAPSNETDYWPVTLGGTMTVKDLRAGAEITYAQLLELLHTRLVNPLPRQVGTLVLVMETGGDPYDVSSYLLKEVSGWDPGPGTATAWSDPGVTRYTRVRVMIRLWRATGWSPLDADKAIHAFGGTPTSDTSAQNLLTNLGELHRLAEHTDLGVPELAAWFADIDTWQDRDAKSEPEPSLFDRTFLSLSLFSAQEQTTGFPFTLNGDRDELQVTGGLLLDESDRIAAVLGLDSDRLQALVTELDGLGSLVQVTGQPELTLGNLSQLYRWTSVARWLDVDPTDAIELASLLGLPPSAGPSGPFTDPATTYDCLDQARGLLDRGWDVDSVHYALAGDAADSVGLDEEAVRAVLGRLRDTVRQLPPETDLAETREALLRQLSEELGVDRAILDGLNGRLLAATELPSDTPVSGFDLRATDEISLAPTATYTSTATLTFIAGVDVTTSTETIDAGQKIVVAPGTPLPLHLLPRGHALTRSGSDWQATDVANLDADAQLLPDGTPVKSLSGPSFSPITSGDVDASHFGASTANPQPFALADVAFVSLVDRFLRAAFVDEGTTDETDPWSDLTAAAFPRDHFVVTLLHRFALIVDRLGADADEYEAWLGRVGTWNLLDPHAVAEAAPGDTAAFDTLHTTADLFALRDRLPGSTPTFATLIADPSPAQVAARTEWDADTVSDAFDGNPSDSVLDFESDIERCELALKLGVTVATATSWSGPGSEAGFDATHARAILGAARAKVPDDDRWATVARPVRDPVRKAQRDALVSLLLSRNAGTFYDADDLYQHFLIDVSMNPEMLTSRIVQANATVQLFVQRCLFGLESDNGESLKLLFTDEDARQWEWMRTYRVWEAARKVFLYPENWIEPELRMDKTPFFGELEDRIAQGEVNADNVESATLDYLDKLLEVADLEVLACYHEVESDQSGSIDRFHVFAATRATPTRYWHRYREDNRWTPWTELTIGITGKHLLPVVVNRRLTLLWAEFTESQSEVEGAEPANWWAVRFHMTEWRDSTWSARRMLDGALELRASWMANAGLHKGATTKYGFVTQVSAQGILSIRALATRATSSLVTTSIWYELATLTLDPCTLSFRVIRNATSTAYQRDVTDPTAWQAPTFEAGAHLIDDQNTVPTTEVLDGELDTTGHAVGNPLPVPLLGSVSGKLVVPSQATDFVSQSPFVVNLSTRPYFVEPLEVEQLDKGVAATDPSLATVYGYRDGIGDSTSTLSEGEQVYEQTDVEKIPTSDQLVGTLRLYRITHLHHPWVCRFVADVRRFGVSGLISPDPDGISADLYRQLLSGPDDAFELAYAPTPAVLTPYPVDDIDFSSGGAYSQYNWEVFFHLPFYVANQLADSGRFKEAIDWFHLMFDPRTTTQPDGSVFGAGLSHGDWWKIKPFLEPVSKPVTDWIAFSGAGDAATQERFESQVAAWRNDPFDPHLMASMRPGTYQRALVMRYLDTLIAWGDQLFTRDTLETVNEATQLYVFALQVLGDRPELLEDIERPTPKSYNDLKPDLDAFSNAVVALENASVVPTSSGTTSAGSASGATLGLTTYFCIPFNERLLSYWDTLADRLFKIRNGMNIAGVARSLPLFQPPIDPAALVRAAAAGVDIASVAGGGPAVGHTRFSVLHQRAMSLAGTVRGLGQGLLQALEKKDAEALARLRHSHEAAMLDAVTAVREQQIDEAKESLKALRQNKRSAEARLKYYDDLLDRGWNGQEKAAAALSAIAGGIEITAGITRLIQSAASSTPDIEAGAVGPVPQGSVKTGGEHLGRIPGAVASSLQIGAGAARAGSGFLTVTAGYRRRKDDWKHQRKLAKREIVALEHQIEGAKLRLDISKAELKNHSLQIAHSDEVWDFMERKYTNQQLYRWMASQLATLHFQTWQIALDTARKAEAAYNHELGRDDSFIGGAHWDSTRKGLLAGERLQLDLERMDLAYLANDVRELELTKHVSLKRLDPLALVGLRTTGECYFTLPRALFDLDCPGHYRRRLRSVSITAACVAGAQGQVNLKLTLHESYLRKEPEDDPTPQGAGKPSITTSTANQDSGVFSADPNGSRYLPFERLGAISDWHLAFSNLEQKQIDWDSVTDVVLHLQYTARDSGAGGTAALADLAGGFPSIAGTPTTSRYVVGLSAKRDAPDAWHQAKSTGATQVTLGLANHLPYFASGYLVKRVHVVAVSTAAAPDGAADVNGGVATPISGDLVGDLFDSGNQLWSSGVDVAPPPPDLDLSWPDGIEVTFATALSTASDDLLVVLEIDLPASP